MTAAAGTEIRAWLAEVWPRTEAALVLAGGDVGVPLADRPVLGEIFDDADLAELRGLAADGEFTGSVCRCPGSLTVALLGADGAVIGAASLHGGTDLAWERGRFRNNLEVADPQGLCAFLSRYGADWL
ncbi:hypothetical protein [Streptomyces sp. NPDC046727]|uniref:hypothetical protein n=1 Tax=Streptomyces sp. NPDC046727 TaxID=3155373 RepID=UPI0033CFCCF8